MLMTQELRATIEYFHFFSYAPTARELYIFLKKPIPFEDFERKLQSLCRKGILTSLVFRNDYRYVPLQFLSCSNPHYTLGGYSINHQLQTKKIHNSRSKLQRVSFFISLIGSLPSVKLVGLSGSVAMLSAKESDDVDLFVITTSKTMWITRLIILLVASALRVRRKYGDSTAQDKVCINLIFDESNLMVPHPKRTEYVAHEILQMKPLVVKGSTYMIFLDTNKWVFDIFPNADMVRREYREYESSMVRLSESQVWRIWSGAFLFICRYLESVAMRLQLMMIQRRRTNERITATQLWFHPDDFERRVRHVLKK